jgi:hypothetical protein
MWNAAVLSDGKWSLPPFIELEGVASATEVRKAAASHFSNDITFHQHLDLEPTEGRHEAIELWSRAAEEESREFDWAHPLRIEAKEEALALAAEGMETRGVATLAWHDHTTIILPLIDRDQHVLLEYAPVWREQNRADRLRHRYAGPDHQLQTILDWRAYFGPMSTAVDGWITMRPRGNGFVASFRARGGFLVGKVLRRLTRPQPTLTSDRTAQSRLSRMSQKYPHIVARYPDVSGIAPAQHESAIVFVHGMVSCAIQSLKDLAAPSAATPIYRFEHDTFEALRTNADALVAHISDRLRVRRLLLAGHSRGGLVARMTADELVRRGYPAGIDVYTFGTPHAGTPLVNIGGRVLNLLLKLGEEIVGMVPVMSPLAKGYSYLVDSPGLPPGVEVMREDSEVLTTINRYGDATRVRCWGSNFDIAGGASGFGVEAEGVLLGALDGAPHDLVVPLHSAIAFGTPAPVLSCSHLNYFSQPMVTAALQGFAAVPALPAMAPAAAVGPAGAVGPDAAQTFDVIGGLRLPR